MKKFFTLAITALALVAMPAFAADYYVDIANGDDANECSESAPCQELTNALVHVLSSGDTLYLAGTFSYDSLTFPAAISGTAEAYTILKQWPEHEHARIVVEVDNKIMGIEDGASYVRFEGLEFTANYSTSGSDGHGIALGNNSQYIEIIDCVIHDVSRNGIFIPSTGSDYTTIAGNVIYDTGDGTVYAAISSSGSYVTIEGNSFNANDYELRINNGQDIVIKNNMLVESADSMAHIYITNAPENISILNNSFYRDSGEGDGIYIAGFTGDNITIENNAFYSMASVGTLYDMTTADQYTLTSDGNIFYSPNKEYIFDSHNGLVDFAGWQALGYDSSSLNEDPVYASIISGEEDLRLQSTSPAIDAGLIMDAVTNDFDGESRPYNGAYDIGADELPVPLAPSEPASSNVMTTTATLSWDAPATATSTYIVEYSVNNDYSDSIIVNDITEATNDLTNLSANITYYYRIGAVYTTGYTSYKSEWLEGSFITDPDPPTNFVVTSKTKNSMSLSWTAPSGTVTLYSFGYYAAEDVDNFFNPTTTETSITLTDLTPNTEYHLSIFASNGSELSESADFLVVRTLPRKVKKVKVPAKFITAGQAKVKWKSAGDDLKYQIKLMNKKGKKIKMYHTTKLKKVIKKLKADKAYKVRVRAKYDAETIGAWSKIVSFRTLTE